MSECVNYTFVPGVRDDAPWPVIRAILHHIQHNTLTPRDLRDWLRAAGLWQKDETPTLLAFLDVQLTPAPLLGPHALRLAAATSDNEAREWLWQRLNDTNVLLVKYVLQALDVADGGRLHSTSELHRLLTSFVYPGRQIGRVAFEAWLKWLVASGRVRLVGIRWGLTELGQKALPKLRQIDADEFLADEREAQTTTELESAPLPNPVQPTGQPPDVRHEPGVCGHAPLPVAQTVTDVQAWATAQGLRSGSRLQALGLNPAAFSERHFVALAALVARLAMTPNLDAGVALLVARAGGWQPIAELLDAPGQLVMQLTAWHLTDATPLTAHARAALLDQTLAQHVAGPTGLAALPQAQTSEALLEQLSAGILRAAPTPALFWLARELVAVGVWQQPAATQIAFVPDRLTRRTAWRLRLISTPFAATVAEYAAIAQRLAVDFPAGSLEAAGLAALAQRETSESDCPRVILCQSF